MISPQIIVAALVSALGFGTAWRLQEWRFGAKEKAYAEQALFNERRAAAAAVRAAEAVNAAQSAAAARAAALRRDADGVRVALVGLHDATAHYMQADATTIDACRQRAAAVGELLETVASAGGELAAKADRHASDVKMMQEAWPR